MRTSVLLLFLCVTVLGLSHVLALMFALYWQYPWFDVPVHALGGACVALSLFALADLTGRVPAWCLRPVPVIVFSLAVGVLWEVFEVAAGLYLAKNYAFDTSVDLLMDTLGGALGYVVGSRVRKL